MASSSDVVKRVLRFKLQLTDTAEAATVLKVLQKLKDLDITLDILAETGIGKTVNSLRRHEQAGEFARSLVKGWKKLLSKECTSLREDEDVSQNMSVQDKPDEGNGLTTITDLNNNCLTSQTKNQDSSDEALFKTDNKKNDLVKQQVERKRKKVNQEKGHENQNVSESDVCERKIQDDETDDSFASKKKKDDQPERESIDSNSLLGSKTSVEPCQSSRSDSKEKPKIPFDIGRFVLEKESYKKPKPPKQLKETTLFESTDKYSNMVRDKAKKRKRKKASKESHSGLEDKQESENKERLRHRRKKAKIKHREKESDSGDEDPTKSFESCLNYDVNVFKRKERCGVKKPSKKHKNVVKEEASKHSAVKPFKSPVMLVNAPPPKQMFQESVVDLMSMSLPAVLPEWEKPTSVEYYDRKADKGSDSCDVPEEPAVFTGQRLNKKMQVYSGAKTVFLPTMMSLYQLCIRTLQNNINLLHDTGGVHFEVLEPVLERCTPEQLLHIEECNPIYIGVTDRLWGKHCQRDFKDSKLQEYESWKEMYIRLSEERERKLQRLTQSIVSAQSKKPKVKMAFIHTVAKPPRHVRIQQEIHGTAVQQPQPLRCSSSVKAEENKLRPTCNEPSRSSGSTSSGSTTQDSRKKTRVAPMMAKSLKAFKKQLGRR